MLLSYEDYISFGGELATSAFDRYAYEAERRICAETHGKIKTPSDAVKRCIARLAEVMAKADISQDAVTSWSNDGVSESIKSVSPEEYEAKIADIIRDYLAGEVDESGVPLLYLGVGE